MRNIGYIILIIFLFSGCKTDTEFVVSENSLSRSNLNGKIQKTTEFYYTYGNDDLISNGYKIRRYNTDGMIIESVTYDANNFIVDEELYTYSSEKMTELVEYSNYDRHFCDAIESIYREDGLIEKQITYNRYFGSGSNNGDLIIEYYYDSNNNVDHLTVMCEEQNLNRYINYIYEEDTIVMEEDKDLNTGTITNYKYLYDKYGNICERNSINEYGEIDSQEKYTYDEYGNQIFYENDTGLLGFKSSYSYKYKYDGDDNWVKRVKVVNGEDKECIDREIEYY